MDAEANAIKEVRSEADNWYDCGYEVNRSLASMSSSQETTYVYDAVDVRYDDTQRFVYPCVLDRSRYTGKERDAESGLDYFGARYYGNTLGRFMTPDFSDESDPIPFAELSDPQTLNLYSYGSNNPLMYFDRDGHTHVDPNSGLTVGDRDGECSKEGLCWNAHNQQWEKPSPPPTDHCDALCEGVFHSAQAQRTWNLSSRVADKYIARPLLTFLSFAVPGALATTLPDVTLGLGVAIASGTTKAAAKAAVEELTISQAQKAAVKRAIGRATTKDAVSVERLADGSLRVLRARPGFDGHQVISTVVEVSGKSIPVQIGVSATGEITHYDPK